MKQIILRAFENDISNLDEFLLQFFVALKHGIPFEIYVDEGPDLKEVMLGNLSILDFISQACKNHKFDEDKIKLVTCNLLQEPDTWPNLCIKDDVSNVIEFSKDKIKTVDIEKIAKTFGIFIGGSRWHRLWLASYLDQYHGNKSLITYWQHHFNNKQPANLYFDDLLMQFNDSADRTIYERLFLFMKKLPMHYNPQDKDNNSNIGYINWDQAYDDLSGAYESIFMDVVCETWHKGKCFLPTEKIFRPMAFGKPFIIFGAKNYLKNLRRMGFKTFGDFWNEDYDQLHGKQRLYKISLLIDQLSKLDGQQLKNKSDQIRPIIEHNQKVMRNFTNESIKKIFNI